MSIENQISSSRPAPQAVLAWTEFSRAITSNSLWIAGAIAALAACVVIWLLILQGRNISVREMQTEWRMSNLENQVAETKKAATDEQARVSQLNSAAADLTRRYLSLEQMIEPRQLSDAQVRDIVTAWKAYSGHSIIIWSYGMDIEGGALADEIKNCLIGAHVVVINNIDRMDATLPVRVGVQIAGADKRFLAALGSALHKIGGLEVTEVEAPDAASAEEAPAEIFVGMRPLPKPPLRGEIFVPLTR